MQANVVSGFGLAYNLQPVITASLPRDIRVRTAFSFKQDLDPWEPTISALMSRQR